jgi:hypothetical protein
MHRRAIVLDTQSLYCEILLLLQLPPLFSKKGGFATDSTAQQTHPQRHRPEKAKEKRSHIQNNDAQVVLVLRNILSHALSHWQEHPHKSKSIRKFQAH